MNIDDLIAAADRLDHLCRHVPVCPLCSSPQVQLMIRQPPASWRCRTCRHRFEMEPVTPT